MLLPVLADVGQVGNLQVAADRVHGVYQATQAAKAETTLLKVVNKHLVGLRRFGQRGDQLAQGVLSCSL